MSTLNLARLQFASTTAIHFLFVLVTLGLVTLVAISQTRFAVTGRPVYERMTRYWGQLYVINYAVGIATGLVMEFQFGLNWTGLTRITGDVFGAPLALETLLAFVLESTFLGLWIFGWGRLPRVAHTVLIWLVAVTAYLSAFWVLVANSFLQHPVGYAVDAGRYRLTSFAALLGNPNLLMALGHVLAAALLTGGLLMAGISAWHFLRRTPEVDFFQRSLRLGLVTAFVGATLVIGFGFAQFGVVNDTQPTKLGGADAQAAMVAAHGPGDYLPPQAVVGSALGIMILAGMVLWLLLLVLLALLPGNRLTRVRMLRPALILLVVAVPVPFLAALLGWVVREVGRQPWAVYGLLRTSDAVAGASRGSMAGSLVGFGVLLLSLAVVDWLLLSRQARRGPGDEFLPTGTAEPDRPGAVFAGGAR